MKFAFAAVAALAIASGVNATTSPTEACADDMARVCGHKMSTGTQAEIDAAVATCMTTAKEEGTLSTMCHTYLTSQDPDEPNPTFREQMSKAKDYLSNGIDSLGNGFAPICKNWECVKSWGSRIWKKLNAGSIACNEDKDRLCEGMKRRERRECFNAKVEAGLVSQKCQDHLDQRARHQQARDDRN